MKSFYKRFNKQILFHLCQYCILLKYKLKLDRKKPNTPKKHDINAIISVFYGCPARFVYPNLYARLKTIPSLRQLI